MSEPASPIQQEMPAQKSCTVYFDGACPLCQREINLYQGLDRQNAIHWHDVSQSPTGTRDLSTRDAMARFHVRRADGTLVSGARGFFEVMKSIPRLRWLGRLLSLPPIWWAAEASYSVFLPLRPWLKRLIPASRKPPRNDAATSV